METEQRTVTADDGCRMNYFVSGPADGKPVVVMHGWGCDHTTVKLIADSLSSSHRVYNVDFPGFGTSPEPPATWGVDDYTRLVERMIAEERLERPALLGHSFGGRVAILAASRSNDYSRIVLVDAAGIKPTRPLKYYLKVYTFKLEKRLLFLFLGREKGQQFIDRHLGKRGSADYRNSSPRMKAIMSRVVNEDLTSCLPLIKSPTLLIWGENDTATPMADARKMEKLIPDSGLVSFPGCGHYSFLDNQFQFKAVLDSFMKS